MFSEEERKLLLRLSRYRIALLEEEKDKAYSLHQWKGEDIWSDEIKLLHTIAEKLKENESC